MSFELFPDGPPHPIRTGRRGEDRKTIEENWDRIFGPKKELPPADADNAPSSGVRE